MKKVIQYLVKQMPLIFKAVSVLVTSTLIVILFPHTHQGTHYDYKMGAIWRGADLVAPYDFAVLKTPDEVKTAQEAERQKAILYYRVDSTARMTAMGRLDKLKADGTAKRKLRTRIDSIYRIGYLQQPDEIDDLTGHTVVVLQGNIGSEHTADEYIKTTDLDAGVLRDSLLVPSLVLDKNRTSVELDSRLSQISYSSQMVMAGDQIIAKGEEVTEEKALIIANLEAENDRRFSSHYSLWGQMLGQK